MSRFVSGSAVQLVAFVILALASASAGRADVEGVLGAEARRQEALIAGEPGLLGEILADDLTYTHSQGRVQSKAELIASLTSGRVRYRSIEVDDPAPRMLGDAAALGMSPVRMVVEAAGRTLNLRSRFLAVYAMRGGAWKLVAYQSTTMGSAATSP